MLTPILLALAAVALAVSALEVAALVGHLARGARTAPDSFRPAISVLKPLCGRDASLESNLASFMRQTGVDYEVLLGVRDRDDAAYPVACALAEQFPSKVRVVVQEGEPGVNPKVNQLVTLARHARGELLVISDSNVRVPPGYLADLVAPLADAEVGMVTSPIAGESGRNLGGQVDALHLHTFITPGVVGSKRVARQDLFIGKSMALRRVDLDALGGFRAFSRVLAEDHALGRAMLHLGKRAELARLPIVNVTDATLRQAFDRYARWGLMQRWLAGPGYPAQLLTFPLVLAGAAALVGRHHPAVLLASAVIALAKLGLDAIAIRALTGSAARARALVLAPLKELVVFAAFLKAFTSNAVAWRGTRFQVTRGTRLMRPEVATRLRRLRRAA
jgi:ceramide glucosyltransferase